jgi:hypothetical protein
MNFLPAEIERMAGLELLKLLNDSIYQLSDESPQPDLKTHFTIAPGLPGGTPFRFSTVSGMVNGYNCVRCRRRALVITDTEEKLMAAAAIMGLSKMPNQG